MPSQYYKLRNVEGVSGGQFTDNDGVESNASRRGPSLAESFNQRVVGSNFHEVNRDSVAYGRLPIGSQVILDRDGQMGPVPLHESPLPDAAPYAPGGAHASWDTAAFNEGLPSHTWWTHQPGDSIQEETELELLGEDWVDVLHEDPEAFENAEEYNPNATPPRRRPRPPRAKVAAPQNSEDRRETFPLRNRGEAEEVELPPHLRTQRRGPFFRPLSGVDHEDLGHIYADINEWRGKLKAINNEIGEIQRECYNDIADGARIKGWLMVGRGLHYLPGIQLIEGRAKEDIRWDELQNEGTRIRTFAFYIITIMVGVFLGIAREFVCHPEDSLLLTDLESSDRRGWVVCCDGAGLWPLLPFLPADIQRQHAWGRRGYIVGCRSGRHALHSHSGMGRPLYVQFIVRKRSPHAQTLGMQSPVICGTLPRHLGVKSQCSRRSFTC